MAVMRSIMYVPGNNPKMVEKAPSIPADIITLDLEDSVPPSEKEAARKLVAEKLKYAGSGGAQVYVRINNWETEMTNDDLEAVVWEGLDGVTLAKTGHPDDVKRLDWKLEELERRRPRHRGSGYARKAQPGLHHPARDGSRRRARRCRCHGAGRYRKRHRP